MTKYTPGYQQGMLTVLWREGGYKYAVACECGNEYTVVSSTQLAMGKGDCGCIVDCQVYFIRGRMNDEYDYMKIGKTHGDIWSRLAVIQTHFPLPVKLERLVNGKESLEKVMHRHFKNYRIHPKREWFHFTSEMLTFLPEGASEQTDIKAGVGDPDLLGI